MAEEIGAWWRHTWMEAVYSSDLKWQERFIAMIYAEHARDQRVAWVPLDLLVHKTGLGRTQAKKWRVSLVEKGWLVEIEAPRQHRAARYVLTIPRGSENRPSDQPRGSENRPSQGVGEPTVWEPRGSDLEPQGVGFEAPGGRRADPDQSFRSIQDQSSSSPAQQHLARLLRWAEDDERLDLLDAFLQANNVKSAKGWLNRCHENGDLERNYLAFVQAQADPWANTPNLDETWMRRKGPDVYELRTKVFAQFKTEQDAIEQIVYEAEAIYGGGHEGQAPGDPTCDRRTLVSVMASIANDRQWSTGSIRGLLPVEQKEAS